MNKRDGKRTLLKRKWQYRVLETHAQPRFSLTGDFLGMIGANADITEQENAQTRVAADLEAMTRLQQLGSLCGREGHDLTKCLSAVVDAATAITGAPRGSLQLFEPRSGTLTIAAQKGLPNHFCGSLRKVREDARVTAAAAMRMRERVVIEDVTSSDIFYDAVSIEVLAKAGVRAVQSTPRGDGHEAELVHGKQIIGMLREQEAGAKTADVCRKYGISSATFYKWKVKYGGLEVSHARRLKPLEDENAKLKELLAEAELDTAMLKEIAAKE